MSYNNHDDYFLYSPSACSSDLVMLLIATIAIVLMLVCGLLWLKGSSSPMRQPTFMERWPERNVLLDWETRNLIARIESDWRRRALTRAPGPCVYSKSRGEYCA